MNSFPTSYDLITQIRSANDVSETDPSIFLAKFDSQLNIYINQYIQEHRNITKRLESLLKTEEQEYLTKSHTRRRRQLVTPDVGVLRDGYSAFLGAQNRRKSPSAKNKRRKGDP
ncbi:hypothetical protein SK128_020754 [Halocaridina rubra]|uniref:Uncharacterized protein n=1 Tax=Halocaridina rubra TaxID=373956 RepID=A0AAN8WTY0_HALRR